RRARRRERALDRGGARRPRRRRLAYGPGRAGRRAMRRPGSRRAPAAVAAVLLTAASALAEPSAPTVTPDGAAPPELPEAEPLEGLGEAEDVEATVTVSVARRPPKEVSRTSLRVAEIEKVPGVAGDPLAVVQNLAGVARSGFGTGQLIVRGAAPEDSRVFVDGMEIPLIYHFGG